MCAADGGRLQHGMVTKLDNYYFCIEYISEYARVESVTLINNLIVLFLLGLTPDLYDNRPFSLLK
jgi:hypothetical protein